MALNYDVAINCLDELGASLADVKIHAYFIQVDSGSSASMWDNDIRLTAGNGKVSFNLGDSSFLTSEGLIKTGDKILISAWVSDADVTNDDKTSKLNNTITKCVNFIHTVDTSSSSWAEDFTVFDVKSPICDITIPTVTNTGHSFTILNSSWVNEGSFTDPNFDRSDLYQNLTNSGQNLFLGLEIEKTIYDYQEAINETTATVDNSYSYIDAGDYTIIVQPYNFLGYFCETIKDEHILYNKPTINFDYTFTKLLNTDKHIGVGNDDLMVTSNLSNTNFGDTWLQLGANFDWKITDTNQDGSVNDDTYLAQDENFEPTKYFMSEGSKEITLNINWNDGFTDFTETKILTPFLDVYSITQKITIITQKLYSVLGTYVPLGDDDLVTLSNLNFDSATQDYVSNSQWKTLDYVVTKLKNDGTDDSENFNFSADNGDDYLTQLTFFVKYYHDSNSPWNIEQTLLYWDGYKDVQKILSVDYSSEKYRITHNFYWSTLMHGNNANIVHDEDEVTVYNTSVFGPQDNQDIVQEDNYDIIKSKYNSYTDETIIDDSENFNYTANNLTNTPKFFVRKDGDFDIDNLITYYDGYDIVTSNKILTLTASVLVPNTIFNYYSRNGTNVDIEGRDDLVTFKNTSYLTDFYDLDYSKTGSRNLSIDWYITNNITAGNYSNINTIGGAVYDTDTLNVDEFLAQDMLFEPTVNYWSIDTQSASMDFNYNDGYFNRTSNISKFITTVPYSDLIPNANYTSVIPDRNTDVIFSDNSTNNEVRIIDIDWSLTDRYESNSMNVDLRNTDNKQTWLNKDRLDEIITTINSNENHTLSQDVIRWDNGFNLVNFNNSYLIYTTVYDINPLFSYRQEFVTGPEIIFTNESTINGKAVLLKYDYEISDTFNDGTDAFTAYRDIPMTQLEQSHTYKSVSNSPFEADVANKEVIIFQDYDDGWNEVYDDYVESILVKPNRISQDFLLTPIRHPSDTETANNIITGNNPIEFHDVSSTERTDDLFITNVKYVITETCI